MKPSPAAHPEIDERPAAPTAPRSDGTGRPAGRRALRRLVTLWWSRALPILALTVIVAVGVILAGLAVGYRPVVIQTGSMGETAPPRSLIIAAPVNAEAITTGDIVVMRRPGATPVTHRVIEIEAQGSKRFAITQGDANEAPDAAPYPLEGDQLVGRWIVPRARRPHPVDLPAGDRARHPGPGHGVGGGQDPAMDLGLRGGARRRRAERGWATGDGQGRAASGGGYSSPHPWPAF